MGGQSARSAVAVWPGLRGLVLLASLAAGCAHAAPTPSAAALAASVLPPPGVGEAPPTVAGPPEGEGQPLPAPRKVPPDGELPRDVRPVPVVVDRECAGPLTLEVAIALALQYQPRLRVFQERVEEARGRGDVAFAAFLPQVGLLARGFVGRNPTGPADASPLPFPYYPDARGFQNYLAAELAVQQVLWDFGRTYGRSQQAQLGIDVAQLQAARAVQTTAFEVAEAYSLVLRGRAALRVARESVRLAESVLGIARKSFKAGLVERDRVLRAEVQLAQARRAVVSAERGEQVAVAGLNRAIGLNVSAPTQVVDWAEDPPFELSLAQCLQQAVANRRELQVARRAIEVAAEGGRVARADFLPQVTADAVVAAAGGEKTLTGPTESAALTLRWNLLQGGRRLGEVRSADAAFRAAVAQARVVGDTIAFEVNEAYRDVEAARQSIALARPAVAQARENLRLVTQKYATGDATPTDVVDAETALTRAEQDLYTARYDYLTALARIQYSMGTTPLPAGACPR